MWVSRLFCIHYQHVSSNEVYCLWLYLKRCSDTWSIFAPRRTGSSGKDDGWCFCLVATVIDLVLIELMTIWLLSHQLDTWSKLSCTLLLICKISSFFSQIVQCYPPTCHNQHICFHVLLKRLKRIGPKTKPLWYTKLYWVFKGVRAMAHDTLHSGMKMI